MRCPTCNKYMPDRCICQKITESKAMPNTTTTLRDALTACLASLVYMERHFNVVSCAEEIAQARAALAAADADQAPDVDENAPWLTLAHTICADAGVPCGHITDRLNALRDVLDAARPAPVGAVQAPDPRLNDLRMLVQRLARSLSMADPDSTRPADALGYLERVGLKGSPLRAAAPAASIVDGQHCMLTADKIFKLYWLPIPGTELKQKIADAVREAIVSNPCVAEHAKPSQEDYAFADSALAKMIPNKIADPDFAEHAKPEPVEQVPLAFVLDFVPEAPDGIAEEALTPDEFALYSAMSDISEERYFAGWIGGNEFELWAALRNGDNGGLNRNTLAYIAAMSVKTGKWIVWHSDADFSLSGPRAISLTEWLAIYDAETSATPAPADSAAEAGQQAGAVDGGVDATLDTPASANQKGE